MTDKTTLSETVRSPIDGTEAVRLATTGANWQASINDILAITPASSLVGTTLAVTVTASSLNSAAGGTFSTGAFAAAYVLPTATNVVLGGVSPDGTTITNTTGAISVTYGTASNTAAQGNDSRITGAVQSGGALGTPSSGTLSGCSGYPADATKANLASPTFTGNVTLPACTTAAAGVLLQAGTVMTTAAAGAEEYDGNCFYLTPAAAARALAPAVYFVRNHTTFTLTSAATVQKMFNVGASGALTLAAGAYFFDCLFGLTSMSGTTGNASFSLANGSGTVSNVLMRCFGIDGANATAAADTGSTAVTAAFPASMVTAGANANMSAYVVGSFEVTAGTIIPSIQLVTAAPAVVGIGSYFRCSSGGIATIASIGNWV